MPCQKSVLVRVFVCHEKCDTTLPFLQLLSAGKSLSAAYKPQLFEFLSLHIPFSLILLVLQLCSFISALLLEKGRIQLLVEKLRSFLEGRCADDYHEGIHTHSCLSVVSAVIWVGFAFGLTPIAAGLHFFKKNIFLPFLNCWMSLFRLFGSARKAENFSIFSDPREYHIGCDCTLPKIRVLPFRAGDNGLGQYSAKRTGLVLIYFSKLWYVTCKQL